MYLVGTERAPADGRLPGAQHGAEAASVERAAPAQGAAQADALPGKRVSDPRGRKRPRGHRHRREGLAGTGLAGEGFAGRGIARMTLPAEASPAKAWWGGLAGIGFVGTLLQRLYWQRLCRQRHCCEGLTV